MMLHPNQEHWQVKGQEVPWAYAYTTEMWDTVSVETELYPISFNKKDDIWNVEASYMLLEGM